MRELWKVIQWDIVGAQFITFIIHYVCTDHKKVLELDPSQSTARQAVMVSLLCLAKQWHARTPRTVKILDKIPCIKQIFFLLFLQYLPDKIKEEHEKLKADMMGEYYLYILPILIFRFFIVFLQAN